MLNAFRVFSQYLIPQHGLSWLCGRLANNRIFYKPFIKWFVKHFKVNMSEALREDIGAYTHFNDFFTRHLKHDARAIDTADASIISPVDGTISQIAQANNGELIQAKGRDYTVTDLLGGDSNAASPFMEGQYATLYLSPKDYHRIHFPIEASVEKMVYVPGKLFAVKPLVVENIPNVFARNERVIIYLETPLGKLAFIMVGAMIVGTMGTHWHGDIKRSKTITTWTYDDNQPHYKKGEELGYFKLGSTVIVLFESQAAFTWDPLLSPGESIRFGQRLGTC